MDEEYEQDYKSEADYYEEEEELDEELDEEKEDAEKEEEEDDPDAEYDPELFEEKDTYQNIIIQKLNEVDKNHKIINIIPDHKRKTSNIIQFPEMVNAIGIRITQIENGSPIYTDTTGLTSPIEMAKKEFIDRQNPLKLQREIKGVDNTKLPLQCYVEIWKVREMTFPVADREILSIKQSQINEFLSEKQQNEISSDPIKDLIINTTKEDETKTEVKTKSKKKTDKKEKN